MTVPRSAALSLALIQFFFALGWTVYALYLPQLAARAGLPPQAVLWLLLLDQLVFTAMDFAMGVAADRLAGVLGRLGLWVLALTLLSCLAFLLLPQVAAPGRAGGFIALTLLWSVTSSALRAPPLVLLGRYAARPALPALTALTLFGLGLASAVAPYLGLQLRGLDPAWPFALSSLALAAATWGIVRVERVLAASVPTAGEAGGAPAQAVAPPSAGLAPGLAPGGFLAAVLLLALGFQVHAFLNSGPLYLRHASAAELPQLLPVFWVGFNLLLMPAGWAHRRWGGPWVMGTGALVAGLAVALAPLAGGLASLVLLQALAGGGWGCVLMSATASALALGRVGREGRLSGALCALLALAAFTRVAVLAAGLHQDAALAPLLGWLPALAWALGGVLLLALARAQQSRAPAAPAWA